MEFKRGDKVELIDKPWEHPLWETFPRSRKLVYRGFIGEQYTVEDIIKHPIVGDIDGVPCADIGEFSIVPLVFLRKIDGKPLPEFKEGDQFVMIGDHWCADAGQVVTYIGKDADSDFSYFTWDTMPSKIPKVSLFWGWLKPVKQKKPQYAEPKAIDLSKYKQVNRKAKVGELILIVDSSAAHSCYKDGDVKMVLSTLIGGVNFSTEQTHPCCEKTGEDGQSYAFHAEYVVLELVEKAKRRYTPEQEQEAREIVYRLMVKPAGLCSTIIIRVYPKKGGYDNGDATKGKPHCFAALIEHKIDNYGILGPDTYHITDRAVAICKSTDEWSDDIGRMVALCKLLHEPLPEWICGH